MVNKAQVFPNVSRYFELNAYEQDRRFIDEFKYKYMGHKLMVPNQNDYFVLPQTYQLKTLFNYGDQFGIIDNVCMHRQAKLLSGSGNTKNISCKLHCWNYRNSGELLGTPHFKSEKISGSLAKEDLHEWNGLLFSGALPQMNLNELGVAEYFDFSQYQYMETQSYSYQFNWKTFLEIYLENYHVFSMHPGLKRYVDPIDLEWSLGEDYSLQKVGMGSDLLRSGTQTYQTWQDHVLKQFNNEPPRYGALWLLIYPNIMIEWYPNVIVISTVYPTGENSCINHVEFYYHRDVFKVNPEYFIAEKDAYMETAVEDEQACLLLDEGRRAMYLNKQEVNRAYVEENLEAGVGEFYNFLSRYKLV